MLQLISFQSCGLFLGQRSFNDGRGEAPSRFMYFNVGAHLAEVVFCYCI